MNCGADTRPEPSHWLNWWSGTISTGTTVPTARLTTSTKTDTTTGPLPLYLAKPAWCVTTATVHWSAALTHPHRDTRICHWQRLLLFTTYGDTSGACTMHSNR